MNGKPIDIARSPHTAPRARAFVRCRAAALAAVAGLCAGTADAAPPSGAGAVGNIESVVAFTEAAPLTANDRSKIEAYYADLARTDPKEAAAQARNASTALNMLGRKQPRTSAQLRLLYRVYYASQPASNPVRAIVEHHDPTIAFDRTQLMLVTEHTLDVVQSAAKFAGSTLGVAVPANFRSVERAVIAANFVHIDPTSKAAYARIESNLIVGEPALAAAPLAERRAALTKFGVATSPNASVGLARDGVSALTLASAKIIGVAAATGRGGGGSFSTANANSRLMMHSLVDQQMRQNIFQIGHPGCAPGGSHPDACNQAPILQPPIFTPVSP